jgi:hypothetical protein
MAILCEDTRTISGSFISICSHLVKIYNIYPMYETIEVQVDNQIIPGVGNVSVRINNEKVTMILLSKNAAAGTATIYFALESIEIPPPTTAAYYLDFYVRPHSWFDANSAANAISLKLTDISGSIINELSKAGIIDWQYVKSEIIPEVGVNRVTIRTYWNTASAMGIEILVTPFMALALIVGIALAIVVLAIGIPFAWSLYKAQQKLTEHTSTDPEVGQLLNDVSEKNKENCKVNFAGDSLGYAKCVKSGIVSVTQAGGDFFDNPTMTQTGEFAASNIDRCIEQFNLNQISGTQLEDCTNKAVDDVTKVITDQTKSKGTEWGSLILLGAGLAAVYIVAKSSEKVVTPVLIERERLASRGG